MNTTNSNIERNQTNINSEKSINSFLKGDNYLAYVFNKTERLVSALYLVTNFLNEDEPVRLAIRSKAVELMSYNARSADFSSLERHSNFRIILRDVIELRSFLNILGRATMISEMNYLILRGEIDNLIAVIEAVEINPSTTDDIALTTDFFANNKSTFFNVSARKHTDSVESDEVKRPFDLSQKDVSNRAKMSNKDETSDTMDDRKILRHRLILSLVSRKGVVTVRQVASIIKDCSEKTIQREMQFMVTKKVLNKSGERRWTRYFLPKKE